MKKCRNCNSVIREEDLYCRNCGVKIPSEVYNILLNIFSLFILISSVFFILLFITSYYLE